MMPVCERLSKPANRCTGIGNVLFQAGCRNLLPVRHAYTQCRKSRYGKLITQLLHLEFINRPTAVSTGARVISHHCRGDLTLQAHKVNLMMLTPTRSADSRCGLLGECPGKHHPPTPRNNILSAVQLICDWGSLHRRASAGVPKSLAFACTQTKNVSFCISGERHAGIGSEHSGSGSSLS